MQGEIRYKWNEMQGGENVKYFCTVFFCAVLFCTVFFRTVFLMSLWITCYLTGWGVGYMVKPLYELLPRIF